ncbi:MAG: phytoene desaturase family protein [Crocinitomicaceae bacterium]
MNHQHHYDTIIIGAGLAGLATAIRLRKRGESILVIEKNKTVGGKLDAFEWNGFRFDKGPSLFTQPELIDELFELCGKDPKEYFTYNKVDESCRYFFEDERLDLFGSKELRRKSLTSKLSEKEIETLEDYLDEVSQSNDFIGDFFLSNPKPGLKDVFKRELLVRYPEFLKFKFRTTLNKYNEKRLQSDKLVKIFNRYGTYNGSNPFQMSGLYSMISHLENNHGTFFPEKGMRSIPDSLFELAKEEGVDFMFDATAEAVKTKGGFEINAPDPISCEKLVCAIDHLTFYQDVLSDKTAFINFKKQERSSSGIVFYWSMDQRYEQLGLHNIFFSDDYEGEFSEIFKKKEIPADPTVYVHVSCVVNPSDAPEGKSNWFVMINIPADNHPSTEMINNVREKVISILENRLKTEVRSNILHEEHWTSKDLEQVTGSYGGALYGASSNSMTSALVRHDNFSKKYKDLYFVGGSVHPGGGIPLVLRSAKIVEQLIYG